MSKNARINLTHCNNFSFFIYIAHKKIPQNIYILYKKEVLLPLSEYFSFLTNRSVLAAKIENGYDKANSKI